MKTILPSRWSAPIVILLLSGCAATPLLSNRPSVDISLLECNYKWFQTGYSEYVDHHCEEGPSGLADQLRTSAQRHAQQVATKRCPSVCPPVVLEDTVAWKNPHANGVCREGRIYYLTRVFYRCGG